MRWPLASRSVAVPTTPRISVNFAKPSQEQIVLLITIVLLLVFGFMLNGFATVSNLLNL